MRALLLGRGPRGLVLGYLAAVLLLAPTATASPPEAVPVGAYDRVLDRWVGGPSAPPLDPWVWPTLGAAVALTVALLLAVALLRRQLRTRTAALAARARELEGEVARRSRAETSLREAVAHLEATLSALPDLLFELDGEGVIHGCHAADPSLLYLPPDRFLGRRVAEVLPPEAAGAVGRALARAAEHGRDVGGTYCLPVGGQPRWFELSVAAKGEPGSPGARFIALARDVTARRELEARLRQAQRMEAVGTLASGVAHDFNNLLQMMSGNLEIARRRSAAAPVGDRLAAVARAIDRAAELVQQLLTFARQAPPRVAAADLNALVVESLRLLERTLPREIRLEVRLAPEPLPILAAATQIEQVLVNLATNARDAMPGGGVLRVSTDEQELDEAALADHPELAPGAYARLTVADSGAGMAPETLARAFDPFFTTKEVGKGTGLGLATVYAVVREHGGRLTCDSAPGQGTTFWIDLPRLPAGSDGPGPTEAAEEGEPPGGSETVLVVDDEADLRELARKALAGAGYGVVEAESGEAALAAAAAGGIDLVVLDVGMPGMGGLACLEALAERHPALPVIVASGYAEDQAATAGGRRARAWVRKPFRHRELLRLVRRTLDEEINRAFASPAR